MTGPLPIMKYRRIVLSIGSNVGDRLGKLQGAIDALFDAPGLDLVGVSSVYETAPVDAPPQDDFLNVVVVADSYLEATTLLERAQSAENAFQRVRNKPKEPRTLDIDLVCVGDVVSDDPALTLPHPRAHKRAFVLLPWQEVDPSAELPGHGPIADLLPAVSDQDVRQRPDLALQPPD